MDQRSNYLPDKARTELTMRDMQRLSQTHPTLADIVCTAFRTSPIAFTITETLRTEARQLQLVREKKSLTMHSYHLKQDDGYSHAVDIAVLRLRGSTPTPEVTWFFEDYEEINRHVQAAASDRNARITWGGAWPTLRDGPHFQIEL